MAKQLDVSKPEDHAVAHALLGEGFERMEEMMTGHVSADADAFREVNIALATITSNAALNAQTVNGIARAMDDMAKNVKHLGEETIKHQARTRTVWVVLSIIYAIAVVASTLYASGNWNSAAATPQVTHPGR